MCEGNISTTDWVITGSNVILAVGTMWAIFLQHRGSVPGAQIPLLEIDVFGVVNDGVEEAYAAHVNMRVLNHKNVPIYIDSIDYSITFNVDLSKFMFKIAEESVVDDVARWTVPYIKNNVFWIKNWVKTTISPYMISEFTAIFHGSGANAINNISVQLHTTNRRRIKAKTSVVNSTWIEKYTAHE